MLTANTLSPREGVFISGLRRLLFYAMFTTVSQAIYPDSGRMW